MSIDPDVPQTPLQRFAIEQALLIAQQLEQVAHEAPAGQVLNLCETLALDLGRVFLRKLLAVSLQDKIDLAEKKRAPARICTCGQKRRHKGYDDRTIVTAVGPITLKRIYFYCLSCQIGDYPLDELLGLSDTLAPRAAAHGLPGKHPR